MSTLATQAEVDKLVRALDLDPAAAGFLGEVPAGQLRALRIAIYELLYEQDRVPLSRLAWLANHVPARLTAALARRVFGPELTGRMAAEIRFDRASEVGLMLPVSFWADVCVDLDPRRSRDLLQRLPTELVVDVAVELVRRDDFMTISRFTDFFSDEALKAAVDAIDDEGALLQIAFYMGSKNRLDHLFGMLSDERLGRLIVQVERDSERLVGPFMSLMVHVSYALKRKLGDLAAEQGPGLLSGYVRATQEQGLWGDALPVAAAMSVPSQARLVNLPILAESHVQRGIVHAADAHGLWGVVLRLIVLMDEANRAAVARIMADEPAGTLERAATAALAGELWASLLDLVRRMPASKQEELGAIVRGLGEIDPALAERISARAGELGMAAV